jgi:hypothetical protein
LPSASRSYGLVHGAATVWMCAPWIDVRVVFAF